MAQDEDDKPVSRRSALKSIRNWFVGGAGVSLGIQGDLDDMARAAANLITPVNPPPPLDWEKIGNHTLVGGVGGVATRSVIKQRLKEAVGRTPEDTAHRQATFEQEQERQRHDDRSKER